MSQNFVIPTKFTAVDGISPVLKSIGQNSASMAAKLQTGVARNERMFNKILPGLRGAAANMLPYTGVAAISLGLAGTAKGISDNEVAMQSLSAVTGVAGKELEDMRMQVNDLAIDTKKSTAEIAAGFEVVGSAMSQYLNDPKALNNITSAGILLAKASRQEVAPSLENLTSIMNQFDIKAEKALDTVNRLTAGEIVGSLRTSQLSEAMQEYGSSAYNANVTLSESVALAEALAKQMKTDKIGVGARNILTVLDSAKGLDKKAKTDLRNSGVSLDILMNKSLSLGQRLRELSKIQNDSTVITSVFGKENKNAAQVIFNQLDTYDQYLQKINTTNEAQRQAAVNSDTLRVKIEQMKNKWINYFTTSENVSSGLVRTKDLIGFLTDNMDTMITVGTTVIGVMAAWRGAILLQKAAMIGLNVVTAATNAVSTAFFIKDMVLYTATTQGLTTATAALKIAQTSLSAAIAANPIGAAITAAALLAGGIYLLSKRNEEYNETLRRQRELDIEGKTKRQSQAVETLIKRYQEVGFSLKEATRKALEFEAVQANIELNAAKVRVSAAKQQQQTAWADSYWTGIGGEVSRADQEVADAQMNLTNAMAKKSGTTSAMISYANQGGLSAKELMSLSSGQKIKTEALTVQPAEQKKGLDFSNNPAWQEMNRNISNSGGQGISELKSAITASIKEGFDRSKLEVNVNSNMPKAAIGLQPSY